MKNRGGEQPTTVIDNRESCSPRQLNRVWARLRNLSANGETSHQYKDSQNNDPVNLDVFATGDIKIYVVAHRHNDQLDDSAGLTAKDKKRVETLYVLYADGDGAKLGAYSDSLSAEHELETKLTRLFDGQDSLTEREFDEQLGLIKEQFASIKHEKNRRVILDMAEQPQSTMSGPGTEVFDSLLARLVPRNYGSGK